MKYIFSLIPLSLSLLFSACTNINHLEEPVIEGDKTVLSVGETISFTVTVNSDDFDCGKFSIEQYEGGGASIFEPNVVLEEKDLSPSLNYTFQFTATETGKFSTHMEVWVKCGSEQGNHSIFSGAGWNFEVL